MGTQEANRRLFQAIVTGNVSRALAALESGADVNARDELTRTPLHLAAKANHKLLAELLVTRQADVNARDPEGATPLHYAACNYDHKLDVAEVLIANGADTVATDNNGVTLRDWARQVDTRGSPGGMAA